MEIKAGMSVRLKDGRLGVIKDVTSDGGIDFRCLSTIRIDLDQIDRIVEHVEIHRNPRNGHIIEAR